MLGRFPTIGFLAQWQVYEGTNIGGYLGVLLAGIRAAARDKGCNLLLASGIGRFAPPDAYVPAWPTPRPDADPIPVGPWNTDGLIVTPDFVSDEPLLYINDVIRQGFPVVFTARSANGLAVGPDNLGGIRQAIAHLYQHGRRRIAFLAGAPHGGGDALARLEAYKLVTTEYGLPLDPDLIEYGYMIANKSYDAVQRLLARGVQFDALIASNDCSAEGAILALTEAGRRVPEDVAVIGFDDQPLALRLNPPLTTVRHPTFEIGYRSVEVLLDAIAGKCAGVHEVEIATQLIIRESCNCRPGLPLIPQPAPDQVVGDTQSVAVLMAEMTCAEARHIVPEAIQPGCLRLIKALSIASGVSGYAQVEQELDWLIALIEEAGDDPYTLHSAITQIGAGLPPMFPTDTELAQFLARSLLTLGERSRRFNARALARQSQMTDRLHHATARLLAALETEQVFAALGDELPKLDINHAVIVLFEADHNDPMAWGRIYGSVGLADRWRGVRFASRTFPPPGLYAADAPYSLALLPLAIPSGASGFVAFDATNLDPCAGIVLHLAVALRSIDLYRQADEGRRSAEEAARLKSRFLSTVSHELRTPLNLIVGLSGVLLHEQSAVPLTPQAQQDLQRIASNAQHLGGLIGDVLDLASSEAGQLHLVCERLDLGEALAVVLSSAEQMAHEKGLVWRAQVPPMLPAVWGDRTRLRQVVLNLISNAVKYTPQGSIALEIHESGDQVVLAVHDSGIGIAPEDQAVVFEEFRRTDRALHNGYGGLGLGLSICKHLIMLHGGTIKVTSPGAMGGVSVFVTLPAQPLAPAAAKKSVSGASRPALLLTECAEHTAELAAHLLRQGLVVEVAELDPQAHWLAAAVAEPPGAVIVDLDLANRHGWAILKGLKSSVATADIQVLCYALGAGQEHGALLEIDHVIKPLAAEQIAAVLARHNQQDAPAPKTLVIVDDDLGTLDLHTRIVKRLAPANRVFTAGDGEEALALIRHVLPDLVLLDLAMPKLDGFGVLEALRSETATRNIPVVLMTAQILSDADVDRLQQGVATVLHKGLFSADETLAHIGDALAHNEKLGSAAQKLVRRAMVYIHEHFDEPFSRKQIGQRLNVNEDYLTDCFHQELGVTPVAYLNRYRILQARLLLELGELSVAEVAAAVGYSDSHYLSRIFQREVGVAPGAYRRGQRSLLN